MTYGRNFYPAYQDVTAPNGWADELQSIFQAATITLQQFQAEWGLG